LLAGPLFFPWACTRAIAKKKSVSLAIELPASTRTLQTLTLLPKPSVLDVQLSMTFSSSEKKYQVQIDKSAVIRLIYTDDVCNMLGKGLCLIINEGPEAMVASYYSILKFQQQPGGQSNEKLSLRAKLDWSLPVMYCRVAQWSRKFHHCICKGAKTHDLRNIYYQSLRAEIRIVTVKCLTESKIMMPAYHFCCNFVNISIEG
jgi:hypothetical protein